MPDNAAQRIFIRCAGGLKRGEGGPSVKHMHGPMTLPANKDVQESLRPIASLIRKSEKAQGKLTPGTWQHAMLRDNLKALRTAATLMTTGTDGNDHWTPDDLRISLHALASMIRKTGKAKARFPAGTPQHTLQRNRLKALRMAKGLIQTMSDRRGASERRRGRRRRRTIASTARLTRAGVDSP